jgi:hypothetical protein
MGERSPSLQELGRADAESRRYEAGLIAGQWSELTRHCPSIWKAALTR